MKRPLLLVGLLYIGGILAAEYIPVPPMPLFYSLGGLTVAALVCSRARADA